LKGRRSVVEGRWKGCRVVVVGSKLLLLEERKRKRSRCCFGRKGRCRVVEEEIGVGVEGYSKSLGVGVGRSSVGSRLGGLDSLKNNGSGGKEGGKRERREKMSFDSLFARLSRAVSFRDKGEKRSYSQFE